MIKICQSSYSNSIPFDWKYGIHSTVNLNVDEKYECRNKLYFDALIVISADNICDFMHFENVSVDNICDFYLLLQNSMDHILRVTNGSHIK